MADLIFLAVIALFAFYGMKKGFLGSLLGMASVLLSMLLGAFLYKPVSMLILESGAGDSVREAAKAFLTGGTGGAAADAASGAMSDAAAKLAVNALSFAGVSVVIRLIITALSSVTNLVAHLPVIKQANKLLGFAVGAASGIAVCYAVILVVSYAAPSGTLSGFAEMIKAAPVSSAFFRNITL